MTTIVNLTPHNINIFDENGNQIMTLNKQTSIDRLPRASVSRRKMADVFGFPIFKTIIGEPENIPAQIEGTIYIVSGLFRSVCSRDDLYQPGELIRNDEGQPIGCIGLSQ